jgi:hypothetical protein
MYLFSSKVWYPIFDSNDPAVKAAQANYDSIDNKESDEAKIAKLILDATIKAADSKNLFTQEQVNGFLAKDKKKSQEEHQRTLDELEALKKKANLTVQERQDLETQIETTRKLLETKEVTAEETISKLTKSHEKELKTVTEERDLWKNRYTSSTIENSLTQAAVEHKAGNPSQVIALLQPTTRLVEDLDNKGKPTGELVPKVSWKDKDDKGKEITLELAPAEVVKRMTTMDEHLNLFVADGTGGPGGYRRPAVAAPDVVELAKDQVAYRKARKEGSINID